MNLSINNINEFINSIHDYIMGEFEIKPRDFEIQLVVGENSICWNAYDNQVLPYTDCCNFLGPVHIHEDDIRLHNYETIVCCSEVDIIALKYLNTSIFGPLKTKIISTLHSWLPAVVLNYVDVVWWKKYDFDKSKGYRIDSYFEPSFLFKLIEYIGIKSEFKSIYYNYYYSYIVDERYYTSYIQEFSKNNTTITLYMQTRRRSYSRGRSPNRSDGTNSANRRRSRSRSRSRSQGRPRKSSNNRKRSRSRSNTRTVGRPRNSGQNNRRRFNRSR